MRSIVSYMNQAGVQLPANVSAACAAFTASLPSVRKESPTQNSIKDESESASQQSNQRVNQQDDEDEQLEVVKTDRITAKRSLADLDSNKIVVSNENKNQAPQELSSYSFPKRIKFDSLNNTANRSYDGQFLNTSNCQTNNLSSTNRRELLDTNLCYS